MRELKAPDVESEATANLHIVVRSRDVDSLRRAIDRIAAAAHDPGLFANVQASDIDDWASDVLDDVGGSVEVRYAIGPPVTMPPVAVPVTAMLETEPVAYRSETVEPVRPVHRVAPTGPLATSPAALSPGPRLTFFDAPSAARVDPPPAPLREDNLEQDAWPDDGDVAEADASRTGAALLPVDLGPLAADQPFVSESGTGHGADGEFALTRDADDDREPRTTWLHLIPWAAAGLVAVAALVALVWLWPTTPTLDAAIPLDQDIPVDANEAVPAPLQTGASVTPSALAAAEPTTPSDEVTDAAPSPAPVAPAVRSPETAPSSTPTPAPPLSAARVVVRSPAPRPTAPVAEAEPAVTLPAAASFVGVLEVVSTPPGAAVAVNNRAVGKTPLVLSDFPAGTHAVRVDLPGFQRWSKAVLVGTGQRARIEAILRANP